MLPYSVILHDKAAGAQLLDEIRTKPVNFSHHSVVRIHM
jgi:hypothetical protein